MSLKSKILIGLLIVLAAGLRLYDLDRGDPISDEVLYGFRASGYLDFDFAKHQPGVPQLFDDQPIPAWTKFSFHDHPPLVFLVQHIFLKLFGDNLWTLRLPSALFGLASIYLLYLIGKKLFSPTGGFVAAGLLATNVLMIYLSRTAVQEAQLIFFILLTIYLFWQALEQPKYFIWTGLALGLGLLTKYTILFLIPVLALYLLLYHRNFFRSKYLYGGGLLSLLIFSPVIIYNILLWQTFGHFDFQWSYFFGQAVDYWQVTPGKEIDTLAGRFLGIFRNFWFYNSPIFNVLAGISWLWFIRSWWSRSDNQKRSRIFLLLLVIFNLILYLLIGPSPRFLSMFIPALSLLLAWFISYILDIYRRYQKIFYAVLFLWLLVEAAYSINSYIFYQPKGRPVWNYSQIHWDMHPWGFNALGQYLDRLLDQQYPYLTVPYSYDFLEKIKKEHLQEAQAQGLSPAKIILIYDENISDLGALWTLNRRALYRAWPILPVAAWRELAAQPEAEEVLKGYSFYFIQPAENMLLVRESERSSQGQDLAKELAARDLRPLTIYNHNGQSAFYIYIWQF